MLWPSNAKPAFLIRTWHKTDGSAMPAAPSEFPDNGYRLLVCMAETEKRFHLKSSIGFSLRQAGKKLLICSPEDFVSPNGRVHCCTVAWRRTRSARGCNDTLVLIQLIPVLGWEQLQCGEAV